MNDFSTKATSHSEAYIVENGDILCDLNKTILNSSQRKISNIRFEKVVIQNNDGTLSIVLRSFFSLKINIFTKNRIRLLARNVPTFSRMHHDVFGPSFSLES